MSVARDQHSGEVDDDSFFLDQILNKLYDIGEHKRSKKSLKRKNVAKDDNADSEENTDNIKHDTDSQQTNSTVCENIPSGSKQSNVEVVTFINPLKKKKLSKAVEPAKKAPVVEENKKKVPHEKLTIEKARLEVHKFGLTGYEKQQQRVFEQERAIMLGAIPPKKKYINYKEYQRNIRNQKMKQKAKANSGFCQESKYKKRKEGKPRIEKRKSSSIRDLGGQVGRFKNGMLVLSTNDIHKLKVKAKK